MSSRQPGKWYRSAQQRIRGATSYRADREIGTSDFHWTVSNLSQGQFNSDIRPFQPNEQGKFGEERQIVANFYPILEFPRSGFVYQYDIQIKNKKSVINSRQRRR